MKKISQKDKKKLFKQLSALERIKENYCDKCENLADLHYFDHTDLLYLEDADLKDYLLDIQLDLKEMKRIIRQSGPIFNRMTSKIEDVIDDIKGL